jgi:hypothetical protein
VLKTARWTQMGDRDLFGPPLDGRSRPERAGASARSDAGGDRVSERQCLLCGRKGSRRFETFMGGNGFVCTSHRACSLRRARYLRGFNTHTRKGRASHMSELLDTSDAVAWAAYFAGILDGEGYIGVQRTKGHLAPRISVRMCDHEVVVALHERYGGCCHASWESHWRDSATGSCRQVIVTRCPTKRRLARSSARDSTRNAAASNR